MSKLTIYVATTDTDDGMETQVFTTEDQAWASLFDAFNTTQEEYEAWKLRQSDADEADRDTFLRDGHLDHLDSFSLEPVEVELPQPYASAPALLKALQRLLSATDADIYSDAEEISDSLREVFEAQAEAASILAEAKGA